MRASTVYADGLSGGLASDGEGNVVEYYGTVRQSTWMAVYSRIGWLTRTCRRMR